MPHIVKIGGYEIVMDELTDEMFTDKTYRLRSEADDMIFKLLLFDDGPIPIFGYSSGDINEPAVLIMFHAGHAGQHVNLRALDEWHTENDKKLMEGF